MTKIIISYLKPFLARNTIRISFSLPPPYALKVPPQKKTGGRGRSLFCLFAFCLRKTRFNRVDNRVDSRLK